MNKIVVCLVFMSSVVGLDLANAQQLNPLFYRQWGVLNEGQPIYIRQADLNFPAQPGIRGMDINYVKASDLAIDTARKVVVAVIDTGIDLEHEDLQGRLWSDPNCEGENCIGKNFLNPEEKPKDDKGHGTHVAGVIAANDNEIGIMGIISQQVEIMPLKVLSRQIDSFTYKRKLVSDYFADAISYAVKNKADVINMSVGFPQLVLTPKFRRAIRLAANNQIPVIVAAGNNRKDIPVFPCNLRGVICVGSVDNTGAFSIFSNFGQAVDILAPGESIVSTYPMNQESRNLRIMGYEKLKGTSQAAPFVAAVAAIIKLAHPSENLAQLKARMFCQARGQILKDEKFSLFGLINMREAITAPVPDCLTLDFKEKSQVIVTASDLSFEYKLNVEKLSGKKSDLNISVDVDERVTLQSSDLSIEQAGVGSHQVLMRGKVNSLLADSIIPFKFKIKSDEKVYTFRANLSFSLDTSVVKTRTLKLEGVKTSDIFQKRGDRRFSLLSYIYSALNQQALPEYFYRQRGAKDTFGILKLEQGEMKLLQLKLEENEQLINIVKGDLNFDGVQDYLALVQLPGEKFNTYFLRYFDKNFNPLFEQNSFKFVDSGALINLQSPINRDGNLLNFQKRLVNFDWLKQSIKGEDILVPIINQEGLTPQDENSTEIVDFEAPGLAVRKYVLTPTILDGEQHLVPKTLLSLQRREEIKEKIYDLGFDVLPWENIRIENPLKYPQHNNGVMEYLLSVGEFYERKYYRYQVDGLDKFSLEPIEAMNRSELILSGNATFPQISPLEGSNNTLVSYSLTERDTGRLTHTDIETGKTYVQRLQTDGYSDPVFGFLSGYQIEGAFHAFIESRYWIHYFLDNQTQFKYPVNRESSFPGVQFSETMEPVFIETKQGVKPGIFVNSTLLYGNQIHVITPTDTGLIRPLKYTIEIPTNCAYALPARVNGKDSLVLNCVEDRQSILKIMSLD